MVIGDGMEVNYICSQKITKYLENDQNFAVLTLDEIIEPGIKPFEEVKSQLNQKIKEVKVKSATLDQANKLLVKLSGSGMRAESGS